MQCIVLIDDPPRGFRDPTLVLCSMVDTGGRGASSISSHKLSRLDKGSIVGVYLGNLVPLRKHLFPLSVLGQGVNLQYILLKSIIKNNIIFVLKININLHFPGGFAHIFSAMRT